MRSRVIEAGNRGIYVSIMLFNGWSVVKEKLGWNLNNPWRGHPFKDINNINGIDGDMNHDNSGEEVHQLLNPSVTTIQEAYVRKVVDTINDLDNVLYEISNESMGNAKDWEYHIINYIKTYEAGKPKQHPVGMTALEWPTSDDFLFNSSADWISPSGTGGDYRNDPPANDGRKVILPDTDHLWGIGGDRIWAWKSFARGLNPIFMDGYDGTAYGVGGAGFDPDNAIWVSLRSNLGYILNYANRMNLVAMTPHGELASSGYALANPVASGAEYLIYLPSGGMVTVDLSAASGPLSVEWFNPEDGTTTDGGTTTGGAVRSFNPPFSGDAVLYICQPTSHTTPTLTQTPTSTLISTHTPTPTRTPTQTCTLVNPQGFFIYLPEIIR
jgi:hypothetical protein